MQLTLSPEDRALRDRLRQFFTTEIPADIRERERLGGETDPQDRRTAQRLLNAAGLAVPAWPQEYGGQDWTSLQQQIYRHELELASVPLPLAFNVNMVGPVIAAFGSPEMKERFLPPTANLDIWWCQGFSEPEAGSDLASLRTTAVRDGEDWIVNGQKTWTTMAQHADWIFVLARTDPDAPKPQQGISFLLIDMAMPGITVRPIQLIDGGHEVNEIFFDNVRVPGDQLVGAVNQGWSYAKFLLGNERVAVSAIGDIKRKLADVKAWADKIESGTGSLLADPWVSRRIAELEAQLMALELTVLRVVGGSRDGKPDPASSVLKLRSSELLQDVLELAVDIAGPLGLRWDQAPDSDLADWMTRAAPKYLNFRKASIYSGSSEVQRQIISTGILGLKG